MSKDARFNEDADILLLNNLNKDYKEQKTK